MNRFSGSMWTPQDSLMTGAMCMPKPYESKGKHRQDESSQLLQITCALWSLFSLSSLPLSVIFVSSSASCFLRFSRLSSSSSSLRNSRWLTMGTLTTDQRRKYHRLLRGGSQEAELVAREWGQQFPCTHPSCGRPTTAQITKLPHTWNAVMHALSIKNFAFLCPAGQGCGDAG